METTKARVLTAVREGHWKLRPRQAIVAVAAPDHGVHGDGGAIVSIGSLDVDGSVFHLSGVG